MLSDKHMTSFNSLVEKYSKILDFKSNNPHKIQGLQTYFYEIDNILNGIQAGDVIIVAGRPAMGVFPFILNSLCNIAYDFKRYNKYYVDSTKNILYFSLDLSSYQFFSHIFSCYLGLSHKDFLEMMNSEDIIASQRIQEASEELKECPIYFYNESNFIEDIKEIIYQFQENENIGLVIIDYLQLLTIKGWENSELTDFEPIMKVIKSIAKELNIPIIVKSKSAKLD